MNPVIFDIALGAVSLGLFAAAYGVALLVTRPTRVTADEATPELGEEPPAVANLLSNRWRLNEDASEATMLDLAARRLIELRQPDNDPFHTTVHLPEGASESAALNPYERRVFERIRGLALGGAVPVTALTFRNEQQARTWNRRLRHEVILDARARGLSRRRFGPGIISSLIAVAAVSAVGVFLAVLHAVLRDVDPEFGGAAMAGIITFVVLSGVAGASIGERDTAAGRAVAARWLGVQRWLRNHDEFSELPPAAVAVWDRYLPYGAALGVTHTASAVLDLGMGNRKLVWSSFGGSWHRVRVRYPMLWARYGRTAPSLLINGAVLLLLGTGVLWLTRSVLAEDTSGQDWLQRPQEIALTYGLPVGLLLLAYGGYLTMRTFIDLIAPRTITGEVLWREKWREQKKNDTSVVWLEYLAVDDGTGDRTKAWGLPTSINGGGCRDGDTVRFKVRPWARRITELTVVERGRAHQMNELGPDVQLDDAGSVGKAAFGALLTTPAVNVGTLLTAEEVSQALGLAVKPAEAAQVPITPIATFATVDRNRQVLMLQLMSGKLGQLARRQYAHGTALPGIGDWAGHYQDQAALQVGDYTLVLTLMREARGRTAHLGWLLTQAATRLAA